MILPLHLDCDVLLCAVLPHGETGAIARLLTVDAGMIVAYVHGGRSRKLRPLLQPGNRLAAQFSARAEGTMPRVALEAVAQRAALASGALPLAVLDWLCSLTAAALPEGDPHPALFTALDALTAGIAAGADGVALGEGLVRYELLLLAELGFGLDLASCAATGSRDDLVYVSPKSAQAVSRGAGLPWASRLLPLPAFLIADTGADAEGVREGLKLTGHFLARDLLSARQPELLAARTRLAARFGLKEASGPPAAGA